MSTYSPTPERDAELLAHLANDPSSAQIPEELRSPDSSGMGTLMRSVRLLAREVERLKGEREG